MRINKKCMDALHRIRQLQIICHIGVLLLVVFFAGCSKRYSDIPAYWPIPYDEYENQGVGRFKTSYLAEQIDEYYRGSDPGPIGVTTLVNLDDLYTTSTFGRMYAEQLISELSMKGYDVVELRHADALQVMNASGEFALSRDTGVLRSTQKLGGVVVGTYTVSPVRVYVNARLIDPKSSVVISAGSVEMTKTKELARMLRGGSVITNMERIPVKHLDYATYPALLFPNALGRKYDLEESEAPALPLPHSGGVVPKLR